MTDYGPTTRQYGVPELIVWFAVLSVFILWIIPFLDGFGRHEEPVRAAPGEVREETVASWIDSWIEW